MDIKILLRFRDAKNMKVNDLVENPIFKWNMDGLFHGQS